MKAESAAKIFLLKYKNSYENSCLNGRYSKTTYKSKFLCLKLDRISQTDTKVGSRSQVFSFHYVSSVSCWNSAYHNHLELSHLSQFIWLEQGNDILVLALSWAKWGQWQDFPRTYSQKSLKPLKLQNLSIPLHVFKFSNFGYANFIKLNM